MRNFRVTDSRCGLACNASAHDAKSLAMWVERCEPEAGETASKTAWVLASMEQKVAKKKVGFGDDFCCFFFWSPFSCFSATLIFVMLEVFPIYLPYVLPNSGRGPVIVTPFFSYSLPPRLLGPHHRPQSSLGVYFELFFGHFRVDLESSLHPTP